MWPRSGRYSRHGSASGCSRMDAEMPLPLLLDTDIGDDVDDIFALLLAACHPEIDLVGVSTVFGDVQDRARLARRMLDLAGKRDVPVAVGERKTLWGRDPVGQGGATMASADTFIAAHPPDEWAALDERLDPHGAVEFLAGAIRSASAPVTLCAIGPLTNVALLFQRHPDVLPRLRRLVLMGGKLGDGAERGEHNFNSDSRATEIVLGAGAPLSIGTYEITAQATLSTADLPRLRAGTAACQAAAIQLERYLGLRGRERTSMYDPLALTLAYTDRFLSVRPVVLRWTIAERLAALATHGDGQPNANVSVALDAPAFTEHLLQTIEAG